MCEGGRSTCVGGGACAPADESPGDVATTARLCSPSVVAAVTPDPIPESDPAGESAPCALKCAPDPPPPPTATLACAAAAASARRFNVTVLGSPGAGSPGSVASLALTPVCESFSQVPRSVGGSVATDPASDLVSSLRSPAMDGATDGATDGAADAPRATRWDPSRTSSSDVTHVPGRDNTVGSAAESIPSWEAPDIIDSTPILWSPPKPPACARSSPTATVPATSTASSSSSTRPRYTSSPAATWTSRMQLLASCRSVSGWSALVVERKTRRQSDCPYEKLKMDAPGQRARFQRGVRWGALDGVGEGVDVVAGA